MTATTTPPLSIGALCRVRNESSPLHGMTATVRSVWPCGRFATVKMTSTDQRRTFAISDLTVVRQPSGAREGAE